MKHVPLILLSLVLVKGFILAPELTLAHAIVSSFLIALYAYNEHLETKRINAEAIQKINKVYEDFKQVIDNRDAVVLKELEDLKARVSKNDLIKVKVNKSEFNW